MQVGSLDDLGGFCTLAEMNLIYVWVAHGSSTGIEHMADISWINEIYDFHRRLHS